MTGNPFAYPWNQIGSSPFPGMLPIVPLSGATELPVATFNDSQVFWVGADFGKLLQANGQAIDPDHIAVTAFVTGSNPDSSANARWTGDAAVVNGLQPPAGTAQVNGAVRRLWGPGLAGVTYGYLATATCADGSVVSQTSQGACITATAVQTVAIASGSYNSGTGVVTLTLASPVSLPANGAFSITSALGTGDFADIVGQWICTNGPVVNSETVAFNVGMSLTMTITGGSLTT